MSPPLEVSDGEDEFEDHKQSSFRKDTSEYNANFLLTSNALKSLKKTDFLNKCYIFQSRQQEENPLVPVPPGLAKKWRHE